MRFHPVIASSQHSGAMEPCSCNWLESSGQARTRKICLNLPRFIIFSSLLMFYRRVQRQLEGSKTLKGNIQILPLYGNLPSEQQDKALLPDPHGELLCHKLCA